MRRLARIAASVAGATLTAVVTAALISPPDEPTTEARTQRTGGDVVMGHASDRLPSQTAEDWVTYADHVVVASAVTEREVAPNEAELQRGEGIIGRQVTMRVDDVLWSRAGASQKPPSTWDYTAAGWQFVAGDTADRRTMVLEDRPRVESDHTYVMALVWEGPRCAEGDGQVPGRWLGLGEGSEIAYDAGVLGNGEEEGRVQQRSAATAPLAAEPENSSTTDTGLEERLAGRPADVLTRELSAAVPAATRQNVAPPADTASCG
ncbi:hypothetical protein [Streptomyces sp. NBC_01506]|uniref:hypothetical protein n=1 Tax=Streptomyces sp. NBC_01506 TaxID=2903887 RepID=UPI0038645065